MPDVSFVLSLVTSAVVLRIVGAITPGFKVESWTAAFIGALVLFGVGLVGFFALRPSGRALVGVLALQLRHQCPWVGGSRPDRARV
jgi:uncharacterized membrane protein YvlD (DUF360 family)